jgi:hypothetical protein
VVIFLEKNKEENSHFKLEDSSRLSTSPTLGPQALHPVVDPAPPNPAHRNPSRRPRLHWQVQLVDSAHRRFLRKASFTTRAIDHQGHGFSDGLVAHIPTSTPSVTTVCPSSTTFLLLYQIRRWNLEEEFRFGIWLEEEGI